MMALFGVSDPDSLSLIRIRHMTKNIKKLQLENNLIFFSSNSLLPVIPRPPKRTSKPQEKPLAHKREHPAL
jgi:hypothetical protein